MTRLLAKRNLKFPQRAVRVGTFHLPTPDHRTQLRIIYAEALPGDTQATRERGAGLMKESPTFAGKLLKDLKSRLGSTQTTSLSKKRF